MKTLLLICFALGGTLSAQKVSILQGNCAKASSIAEGAIGTDLSQRQSQFFCDVATITHFDNSRVLISFSLKGSHHSPNISFAGVPNNDGAVDVDRVYFSSKDPTAASEGLCKIFRENDKITGIGCGAKVDEGHMRTVPIIAFDVTAVE